MLSVSPTLMVAETSGEFSRTGVTETCVSVPGWVVGWVVGWVPPETTVRWMTAFLTY